MPKPGCAPSLIFSVIVIRIIAFVYYPLDVSEIILYYFA